MTRARWAASALVTLVFVGAVLVFAGLVFSSLLGEPDSGMKPRVGVGRRGDSVEIFACPGTDLGSVEIQLGNEYDGDVVWSARQVGGGLAAIPVERNVPGYKVSSSQSLDDDELYALIDATDSRGNSLLDNSIPFRPKDLGMGLVLDENGMRASFDAFEQNCVQD